MLPNTIPACDRAYKNRVCGHTQLFQSFFSHNLLLHHCIAMNFSQFQLNVSGFVYVLRVTEWKHSITVTRYKLQGIFCAHKPGFSRPCHKCIASLLFHRFLNPKLVILTLKQTKIFGVLDKKSPLAGSAVVSCRYIKTLRYSEC